MVAGVGHAFGDSRILQRGDVGRFAFGAARFHCAPQSCPGFVTHRQRQAVDDIHKRLGQFPACPIG